MRDQRLYFIVLLETNDLILLHPFLKHLSLGLDFMWCYLPPSGRSGGILVGINMETTSIQRVGIGDFCVRFWLSLNLMVLSGSFREFMEQPKMH
jgi:hypothetical protein